MAPSHRRAGADAVAYALAAIMIMGTAPLAQASTITAVGESLQSGQARQTQAQKNLENETQQSLDAQEKQRIAAAAAARYRTETSGVAQVPPVSGGSGCYPPSPRPKAHAPMKGLNPAGAPTDGEPRDKAVLIAKKTPKTVEGLFTPVQPSVEGITDPPPEVDTDWLVASLTFPAPPQPPPEIDPATASPADLAWMAGYRSTELRASVITDAYEAVLSRPDPEGVQTQLELSRYTDEAWHAWLSVTSEEGAWRAVTQLQAHSVAMEARKKVLLERLLSVQATRLAYRAGGEIDELDYLRGAAVEQRVSTGN